MTRDTPEQPDGPDRSAKKKLKKRWIIIIAAAVLAVVFIVLASLSSSRKSLTSAAYTPYTVKRGDITVTLSGSGTLQPADAYTLNALVSGDVLSAPFEEGDTVQKGDVLYTVDNADVAAAVQQAENSVGDNQRQYNNALKLQSDLTLKAGGAGSVTQLAVQPGDTVAAGQTVAVIRDMNVMSVTVQFQKSAAAGFSVGQSADVFINNFYETLPGVVSKVSSVDIVLPGNIIVRNVTIDVNNPGAISTATTASATIGGTTSIVDGTFTYKYEGSLKAPASATVMTVSAPEGSRVAKGQTVVVLQSNDVDNQVSAAHSALENAQINLSTQQRKLESYTVTSPIDGTIVEKIVKQGDTLKVGEGVCTVYDLSHLSLTLNVDELDIKSVRPGQAVTLTADAAPGMTFNGVVVTVNIKGTTKNGVTSYPVTIQLDETDALLPGMNVDAKIILESLHDVLTVPVAAVLRDNFVLLQTGTKEKTDAGIPTGFTSTPVTLGPSSDTDIVITGGLKEGDVIAVMDNTPTSYDTNLFAGRAENRIDNASNTSSGAPTTDSAADSGDTPAGNAG
ncbi:HlyD family efflux transporter periplasmic adaptor subunit [Oscillospiraceae bacterium CM]|nr:HlyD family efflux transporter periplasmic adaptor subunit [Oscillospiraceae bacterium CM]